MVLWGSLSLAQDLIAADLIDEYHIRLCPTAAGRRATVVPHASRATRTFERVNARLYDTGVVFLHYEPQH